MNNIEIYNFENIFITINKNKKKIINDLSIINNTINIDDIYYNIITIDNIFNKKICDWIINDFNFDTNNKILINNLKICYNFINNFIYNIVFKEIEIKYNLNKWNLGINKLIIEKYTLNEDIIFEEANNKNEFIFKILLNNDNIEYLLLPILKNVKYDNINENDIKQKYLKELKFNSCLIFSEKYNYYNIPNNNNNQIYILTGYINYLNGTDCFNYNVHPNELL